MKKSVAAIQARLRQISISESKDFVLIIRLYMQEGVLRRIGKSKYAHSFYLKSGLLLFSLSGFKGRPTKDIDLLGSKIPGDQTQIKRIISRILTIPAEDGLVYATESMTLEEITEGADYKGQRLKIECHLGNIRTNLKIDIGFGDIIFPEPIQMDYPTLLETESIIVYAYSLESVISEKFEAMIALDARNSRMKDFFDIHMILSTRSIDQESLEEAVRLTLKTRQTFLPAAPAIFQESFASDPRNQQLWEAFLKRIKTDPISFQKVLSTVQKNLLPIYRKIRGQTVQTQAD